jgi:hypothetical protein
MRRLVIALGLSACVALGGCVSQQELAARDDATCNSYGLQYGSPGYADCRMRIAENRQQALQAALAQINENNRRQQEANAQALRDQQALLQASRPPPATTTTCTRTSNVTVSCNSY